MEEQRRERKELRGEGKEFRDRVGGVGSGKDRKETIVRFFGGGTKYLQQNTTEAKS